MPVSHVSVNVHDIPSSTSFYLSALHPLGYHYAGTQRDSVGFAIDQADADLFLCPEQPGTRPSPTHVAFAADSRATVRNCYAAALRAGGQPNGAPDYRNQDCSCFNAAVTDLDGNTLEFIYKETCRPGISHSDDTPAPLSRSRTFAGASPSSRYDDDTRTHLTNPSRTRTAYDTATSAARSSQRPPSQPGISRARTEPPIPSDNKKLVGTLLGAAAGAAFAYAMVQSERAPSSRLSSRSRVRDDTAKSNLSSRSSRSHRREPLRLEGAGDTYLDVLTRYTSSRPTPQRSRTQELISYPPRSSVSTQSARPRRSSTFPNEILDDRYPSTAPASRFTSRRGSMDSAPLSRHDSAVSTSRHSGSKTGWEKPSRAPSTHYQAVNTKLPSSRAASSKSSSYVGGRSRRRSFGVEEDDGVDDSRTIVPEDSISCVDFSAKSRSSRRSSKGRSSKGRSSEARAEEARRSERRDSERRDSEASTIKPLRREGRSGGGGGGARSLPVRGRREEEGRRGAYSYA